MQKRPRGEIVSPGPSSPCGIDDLDDEELAGVFTFLSDCHDIARAASVCRRWRRIATASDFSASIWEAATSHVQPRPQKRLLALPSSVRGVDVASWAEFPERVFTPRLCAGLLRVDIGAVEKETLGSLLASTPLLRSLSFTPAVVPFGVPDAQRHWTTAEVDLRGTIGGSRCQLTLERLCVVSCPGRPIRLPALPSLRSLCLPCDSIDDEAASALVATSPELEEVEFDDHACSGCTPHFMALPRLASLDSIDSFLVVLLGNAIKRIGCSIPVNCRYSIRSLSVLWDPDSVVMGSIEPIDVLLTAISILANLPSLGDLTIRNTRLTTPREGELGRLPTSASVQMPGIRRVHTVGWIPPVVFLCFTFSSLRTFAVSSCHLTEASLWAIAGVKSLEEVHVDDCEGAVRDLLSALANGACASTITAVSFSICRMFDAGPTTTGSLQGGLLPSLLHLSFRKAAFVTGGWLGKSLRMMPALRVLEASECKGLNSSAGLVEAIAGGNVPHLNEVILRHTPKGFKMSDIAASSREHGFTLNPGK